MTAPPGRCIGRGDLQKFCQNEREPGHWYCRRCRARLGYIKDARKDRRRVKSWEKESAT